uniref:Uncharacterized protein n=1 Tax=Meloidogyne enterolobii TaxID=390850 RepID=A0A6V7USH0_MELEN|nr:unnamed protein product [Meloidogyne enterolobii]
MDSNKMDSTNLKSIVNVRHQHASSSSFRSAPTTTTTEPLTATKDQKMCLCNSCLCRYNKRRKISSDAEQPVSNMANWWLQQTCLYLLLFVLLLGRL